MFPRGQLRNHPAKTGVDLILTTEDTCEQGVAVLKHRRRRIVARGLYSQGEHGMKNVKKMIAKGKK